MATFAQRLRELRNKKEITQTELGNIIGVSKSSVNMYERGAREPGFETLEAIADYFNVDMDYLMGRSEDKASSSYEPIDKQNPEISDPDIRRIERAKSKMSEKEWNKQLAIIRASFGDYFSDDYEDEDINE